MKRWSITGILAAGAMAAAWGSVLAGLVASSGPAAAQTVGSEPPRRNPNVPAITGDRQEVPMGGNNRPGVEESTRGSATGLVRMEQRPRLREHALKHREGELRLQTDIRVGTVLPADAALIDIPAEFGLDRYRLALANQKTLLVDPASRRVEEVID